MLMHNSCESTALLIGGVRAEDSSANDFQGLTSFDGRSKYYATLPARPWGLGTEYTVAAEGAAKTGLYHTKASRQICLSASYYASA